MESGDFLFERTPPDPAETEAGRARADLILKAYRRMGYDAVLPGDADLSAGVSFLRRYANAGVPFTCLNLVSARSGKPLFPPTRAISRNGMRVLVTGLLGPDVVSGSHPKGRDWKVVPPQEALDRLLAGRQAAGADLVVVLSHMGASRDLALARRGNRPFLVFGGHLEGPPKPPAFESVAAVFQPHEKGTQLLEVSVGPVPRSAKNDRPGFADAGRASQYKLKKQQLLSEMRGMDARRRALYEKAVESLDNAVRTAERKRPLYSRMIPLDSRIPDDPKIAALLSEYQSALARIATKSDAAGTRSGQYRGHRACSGCHAKNYAAWKTRAHARAFETLADRGDAENPDCLRCHVTGYGRGGFVLSSPAGPADFGGVGCEACHGPGYGHPGRRMAIPGEKVCAGCHVGRGRFPYSAKRLLLGCVTASRGN